jgi:hypothetical protein
MENLDEHDKAKSDGKTYFENFWGGHDAATKD